MDLIDRLLGPRACDLLNRAIEVFCALLMFLLTWLMWLKAGKVAGYTDSTDVLRIPPRAFRLLHGGDDRAVGRGAPLPGLRGRGLPMIEGLVALAAMLALGCSCASRSPSRWRSSGPSVTPTCATGTGRSPSPPCRPMSTSGTQLPLSVVPLFILMGDFVARAGIAQELFRAAYAFIGHRRGGLAMATIMACAGFGSICGSSIATAATMAKVAYPSMKRFNYSDQLAAGAIAAGGTLGIMIPPSTVDGYLRDLHRDQHRQDVRRWHPAGILGAALLCVAVAVDVLARCQGPALRVSVQAGASAA